MLTKETIEQAIPFIEDSWWLMCDASADDWELKNPTYLVRLDAFRETLIVTIVFYRGELRIKQWGDDPKRDTVRQFEIPFSESPRKLVKEVHDALEHIMKEPYDYYLEED